MIFLPSSGGRGTVFNAKVVQEEKVDKLTNIHLSVLKCLECFITV